MILDPRLRSGRLVLATLLVLVLGIGACSIPSSYEEEVGQAVEIRLSDRVERNAPAIDKMIVAIEQMPGVQNVSIQEQMMADGSYKIDIMLWGEDINAEEIRALIGEQFPELADAQVSTRPIEGTVECNLGDRILHDVFEIEVEGGDAESIRRQILEQLLAQGHENAEVMVEVHEADGQATIEVEITEDCCNED